ncbi:MAG: hypothetical protein V7K95_19130 [Nostoc sp.]
MCNSALTPHSLETVGRVLWTQPATTGYTPIVSATVSGSPRKKARSQLRFIRRPSKYLNGYR